MLMQPDLGDRPEITRWPPPGGWCCRSSYYYTPSITSTSTLFNTKGTRRPVGLRCWLDEIWGVELQSGCNSQAGAEAGGGLDLVSSTVWSLCCPAGSGSDCQADLRCNLLQPVVIYSEFILGGKKENVIQIWLLSAVKYGVKRVSYEL